MAVDLGLSYIKVAIARPANGLQLVTNEQSKRKTPAAIAFTEQHERLFGDAAVAYASKAPQRAVLHARELLAQCDTQHANNNSAPHALCQRLRYHVPGVAHFSGEQLVAMLLTMARRQAAAALGADAAVNDVAITVPCWFDERQRLAVADAARVAGLNCLGVITANTAAAIKYALDGKPAAASQHIADAGSPSPSPKRASKPQPHRVLFYDAGASGACASVAEFSAPAVGAATSAVRMLSHAWEQHVGGHALDHVLVQRLARAFDQQRDASATPAAQLPRVMARLRREAQKVREVLSANSATHVSVGSLHHDVDLSASLTRAEFEADAQALFARVATPALTALRYARLQPSQLHAVVPFGGVSRTPRVQKELCEALHVRALNKSINSDEAAVMGAAFFAASLSSTFRVRKLQLEDVYARGVSADVQKERKSGLFSTSATGGAPAVQRVQLFEAGGAKMPSKKTLSVNKKGDFALQLFLDEDKSGRARFPERTLYASIKVKGVANVLGKLKDASKAKRATPRVALTVHMDRSGNLRIGTAESSVDETVVVEREVLVDDDSEEEQQQQADDEDGEGEAAKASASEQLGEEEQATTCDADSEQCTQDGDDAKGKEKAKQQKKTKKKKKKKKKSKIEKSTQTVVHRVALDIEYVEGEGVYGMQMSGAQLEAAKKTLQDLEDADNERLERDNALNALEGYILEAGSKLRDGELEEEQGEWRRVCTAEQRLDAVRALDEAEEWMYSQQAKQTADVRNKHHELQTLLEHVRMRATEAAKRPEALRTLLAATESGEQQLAGLRELHVQRNSARVAELDGAIEFVQSVRAWMRQREAQQAQTALTEAPVVTVREIMAQGEALRERVQKALSIGAPAAEAEAEAEAEADGGSGGRRGQCDGHGGGSTSLARQAAHGGGDERGGRRATRGAATGGAGAR
eukprot:TRINITY_DN30_c0_g3_i5.p1 TRINITY_DN30_c0_g3~~TRINITY_DN30_c0_g3_i5.p1  ORF type:complete len:928 (-),score=311.89 TRINITY_DN30_c0_g3_i5:459-3242(-)